MSASKSPVLHVSAHDIPVPSSVSAQAQAMLARGRAEFSGYPPVDDLLSWRKVIAARNEALLPMMLAQTANIAAEVAEIEVAGAPVYVITPPGCGPDDRRVYLEIHGGALVMCGGACCRALGIGNAARVGARVWAVDYRMPPDHPYPAPLDDCVAAYRALLKDYPPEKIIVGGVSAGGNLAAALILRARDEGLPLPAAAVLVTPEVDLTESGDSFQTNLQLDTVVSGSLMLPNLLYADGHDLAHPYLSPLFGDFSKGFPPTFLMSGTRDLFLSNTVRMHRALRAAGVAAELHVLEGAPHGGFGGAPEDREIDREIRCFVDRHWGSGPATEHSQTNSKA